MKTDPRMEKLYSWLAGDELLAREPLLRAAILYWALSELPTRGIARMGIDAVVAHELRAGASTGTGSSSSRSTSTVARRWRCGAG